MNAKHIVKSAILSIFVVIMATLFLSCAATRLKTVDREIPEEFNVAQNEPNPFNSATTISFSLAKAGNTTVEIYTVTGKKVDTLVNEYIKAGSYSIDWDGSNFSSNVYFYTVKSGDFNRTMKMTLLK